MFDILNKYNLNFQLAPWYDHQVHGKYEVEDAIVDAILTGSFRAILASLKLFNHVKDWKRLYKLANKRGIWQKVGALYEVSYNNFRTRVMPKKYDTLSFRSWKQLTQLKDRGNYPDIQKKWQVYIPFNQKDLSEL